MTFTFGLSRDEWVFGWFIASVHAVQHVFYRFVPPLIPILVVDLGTPLWQLGLLVSIYMFAGGAFQAPMGELSDRIDRRYILAASVAAMSVGYLVFVVAPTLGTRLPAVEPLGYRFTGTYLLMSLGMFVAGVGYSGIHPVGYPLISANVSPENKGKVLGMWGSASKVGDAIAPLLVGVLVLVVAWEWVVVTVALFGFAYAVGCLVLIRRGGYETRPDPASDEEDGGLALRSEPRRFLFPILVMLAFFLCLLFAGNGLVTFAPLFVSDVYGYSVSVAGFEFGPESVGNFYFGALLISAAVSQLVSGAVTDRFDHRAVIVSYLAVSTACLAVLATASLSPLTLLVTFTVLGGTIYGINPARDALISDISPDAYEGRTFGYVFTVALVGGSAFPAVIGYLADLFGVRWSFGVLAVGTAIGLLVVCLLYSPRVYVD